MYAHKTKVMTNRFSTVKSCMEMSIFHSMENKYNMILVLAKKNSILNEKKKIPLKMYGNGMLKSALPQVHTCLIVCFMCDKHFLR